MSLRGTCDNDLGGREGGRGVSAKWNHTVERSVTFSALYAPRRRSGKLHPIHDE